MKKTFPYEIHFRENDFKTAIQGLELQIPNYQKIVDEFLKLKLDYTLQKNDLFRLLKDPKSLIVEILIKDKEFSLFGLKIKKEKVLDFIDKEEFELFINLINQVESEAKKFPYNNHFFIENHSKFEIKDNVVYVCSDLINEYKKSNTTYIENKEQELALELLEDIATKFTKLSKMKPYITSLNSFEQFFILKAKSVGNEIESFNVNLSSLNNF